MFWQAIVSELWHLLSQLINGLSAIFVSLTYDSGFVVKRRRRFVPRNSPRPALQLDQYILHSIYFYNRNTPTTQFQALISMSEQKDQEKLVISPKSGKPPPLKFSDSCPPIIPQPPPQQQQSQENKKDNKKKNNKTFIRILWFLFSPYIILYLYVHMIIGIIQIFFPFQFYPKQSFTDNSRVPYYCIIFNILFIFIY